MSINLYECLLILLALLDHGHKCVTCGSLNQWRSYFHAQVQAT